jgi:hypothetical protein
MLPYAPCGMVPLRLCVFPQVQKVTQGRKDAETQGAEGGDGPDDGMLPYAPCGMVPLRLCVFPQGPQKVTQGRKDAETQGLKAVMFRMKDAPLRPLRHGAIASLRFSPGPEGNARTQGRRDAGAQGGDVSDD